MTQVIPQLRPFINMMWAALGSEGAGRKHVFTRQIRSGLLWLQAFLREEATAIQRAIDFRPPRTTTVVAWDASTTGGGAVLWVVPMEDCPETGQLPSLLHRTPSMYVEVGWTNTHERLAAAKIGEAASQARWEAFMLVLAILTWLPVLQASRGAWHFMGDALGVLTGAVNFHSKDPQINAMMMEISIVTAGTGRELSAEHIWSETNSLADALSRLEEGERIPQELSELKRVDPPLPKWRILGKLHQAPLP